MRVKKSTVKKATTRKSNTRVNDSSKQGCGVFSKLIIFMIFVATISTIIFIELNKSYAYYSLKTNQCVYWENNKSADKYSCETMPENSTILWLK